MQNNQPAAARTKSKNAGWRYRIVGLAACFVVFGLLIWAKLQLVASIPRTVLAVPTATPTDQPSSGQAPAPIHDKP